MRQTTKTVLFAVTLLASTTTSVKCVPTPRQFTRLEVQTIVNFLCDTQKERTSILEELSQYTIKETDIVELTNAITHWRDNLRNPSPQPAPPELNPAMIP